jgi:hypothetical protein
VKKRLEYAENKEYERSKEGKETISSGCYKVALLLNERQAGLWDGRTAK